MTPAADHLLVLTHLLREAEIDASFAARLCHRRQSDARWLPVPMAIRAELPEAGRLGVHTLLDLDPEPGDTRQAPGSGNANSIRQARRGSASLRILEVLWTRVYRGEPRLPMRICPRIPCQVGGR